MLFTWVLLFVLLLQRDYFVKTLDIREAQIIKQAKEESFLGVYFQGQRIGYVKYRLAETANGVFTLFQDAFLRLNILNEIHPVNMKLQAQLNSEFLLQNFNFQLTSPFYGMEASGTVENNIVHFSINTGKQTITDEIRLERPPFLSTNQRGYLLKQNLKAGDKIKIPYFDPISLAGKDTIMEYRGLEKILIKGRIHKLHHFTETFSGIRINSWLDNNGKVIKEESPAGFVFMNEPEFQATSIIGKGSEILGAVSVPLQGKMPDVSNLQSIRYRLQLPEGGEFDLAGGRQTLDGTILTVTHELFPLQDASPCLDKKKESASTPYIQSDNPLIKTQAESISERYQAPFEKIKALTRWVYGTLEKRPVIGIPDALTTLTTKKGDCNEHAALFAALARSIGVPTRVAAGVMYHKGAFFYHAWNEVCLDGKWISLDSTLNQIPADLTHIRFVHGETQEMIRIGALIGKLQIEVLQEPKKSSHNKHRD